MADTSNLSKFLGDVAEAIRTKRETTDKIPAEQFDSEILKIESGLDTSDATATQDDIALNKTAYVNGEKVIGTVFPISGDWQNDADTITKPFDKLRVKTTMPIDYLFRKGTGVELEATNEAIAEVEGITADKIVKGNIIFGVEGTAEGGSGIDTSDATATSDNITVNKTAYVNGEKITGTLKFAGIYIAESMLPSGSEYHDSFAIINQEVDYPTRPGNYSDYCILNNNGTIYLMQFDATESHKLYIQKSQYTWSTTNYGNRKTIYWWKLNAANNTWVTHMSGYSCGQMLENTSFANYIESTFQLIDIEDGVSSRPVLRDVKERELILPELWLNAAGTWRKELVDTTDGNRDASKLLSGYSMYAYNQKISGTMPNNGSLEYNPTTTTQFIPTGYTSGGVINAVDATIDENIVPENIKKGVTILGIEGTAIFGNRVNGVVTFEDRDSLLADTSEKVNTVGLVQTLAPTAWEFKQNMNTNMFLIPKNITLTTAPTEGKYYPIYYVNDTGDGPGMGPMTQITIHHPSTTDGVHYYIQEGDFMMGNVKSWVSDDGINYVSETNSDDMVQSDNYTWYIGGDSTEFTEEDISILTAIIHELSYGVPEIYLWDGTEWEQYGNLTGTITSQEYNQALDTATEILGNEEV